MEVQHPKNKFFIVGIGASAGGLSAINEFFDEIQVNTGFAFIVVQHLSPDFKSVMDELLSKHTHMSIQVVRKNTAVQPNSIYLIPKENNIILEGGEIRLVARNDRFSINLPIDEFFHSLAKEQREKAIGVILSGTGSDGSRGVLSISERGGTVLVQDPETAQFDGMPRAAIDTKMADEVLAPKALARLIVSMSKPYNTSGLQLLNINDDAQSEIFQKILDRVENITGVDFSEYRRTTLYRRIEKRIFLTSNRSIEEYLDYLKENWEEVELLHKEFFIGVTRFFRDKEAFEVIHKQVLPDIIDSHAAREPIRIWVAGCCTGEEAYSIAILMEDLLEEKRRNISYKIFASDLDANAIQHASRGIYARSIMSDIPSQIIEKHFSPTSDKRFAVGKHLRDKVVFTVHDALSDPPFINMDLVSCRNLLIYLKPAVQQMLLTNFQFALNHRGYLFLGPSESIGEVKSAFKTIDSTWNIFQNTLQTKLNPVRRKKKGGRGLSHPQRKPAETADRQPHGHSLEERFYTDHLLRKHAPITLFVTEEMDVLFTNGAIEQLFSFPQRTARFNLENMVVDADLIVFKNGIRRCIEDNKTNRYTGISFEKNDQQFLLDLTFEPMTTRNGQRKVVSIEIVIQQTDQQTSAAELTVKDERIYQNERFATLENELQTYRYEKQVLVEKLETANEELQSSNEELLAANEELQSTNEELQSVNEELYTVNAELQEKIAALVIANTDMDNLIKATQLGSIFVDEHLKIRWFTPAIQQNFSLEPSDVGRPITDFVNNFEKVKIYEFFEKTLRESKKIQKELVDKKGNPYLMRLIPYQNNKVTKGVVATFINITEVKEQTREMNRLANLFQTIFRRTDTNIAVLDTDLHIEKINYTIGNQHAADLEGRRFTDTLEPAAREPFEQHFHKAVSTKRQVNFEQDVISQRSERKTYNFAIVPVVVDKRVVNIIVNITDQTWIQDIRKEVRMKASIFRAIFEHAQEHIMITDFKGNIIDINYTELGYRKENLIDQNIVDISPDYNKEILRGVLNKIQSGVQVVKYDNHVEGPNGQKAYYHNIAFPIHSKSEISHIVFLIRNYTKQRNTEQSSLAKQKELERKVLAKIDELTTTNSSLSEMNDYMDTFVHGVAHDLRSPVMQIKGFLQLYPALQKEEDRLANISRVNLAVANIEQVLNGLIELIHFQQSGSGIIKEIGVLHMYQQIAERLGVTNNTEDISVQVDIPADLYITYIEAYLQSILFNLLDNAIKYKADHRPAKIEVRAKRAGESDLYLEVKDNGIGMDLDRYGHFLFKPFKRLTVDRRGTGIGLSIINSIVRKNGGTIEVESKLDKGATFMVHLKSLELKEIEEKGQILN